MASGVASYVLSSHGFAKEKEGLRTCRKPRSYLVFPKHTYMPFQRCDTCGEFVSDHLSMCFSDRVTLLLNGCRAQDPCPLCGIAQQYHRLLKKNCTLDSCNKLEYQMDDSNAT